MISFAFANAKPLQGRKHFKPGVQLAQWIMPLWPPAGSVELEMQKLGKCPCQRHSRGQFPLLVAVTCYLQSPAKADTKVVTELLQCSGYSRMLEQPPLGPKTSELKPITSTGKARGLNPASSLLGPKPSIY